ncbi:PorP/SprF family type IX secretion system membrane protein [Maribacter sp. 2307UL18-2]|uniref:PorP/SprF family type IX secretion system membrane protein n=1 Tax=Maribacter sp. 2307UL18-2 TaxID=3386274 RepID=UPI0039BCB55F
MKLRNLFALSLIAFSSLTMVSVLNAQEDDPILPYRVAPQNLLKFNRFLINPTFTTVREDKSYINLLHRNQSVQFQDNDQTYFLSYSGRMGDRSGLGLSLYTQRLGPVQNIGVLANYAYGIKLSDKSNFTFGGNLAYYSTGLNRNDVDVIDPNDFRLNGTEDSNILSFQPGFNLSYGQFDFGVFAENLFDYNLKTSETLTEFSDKTYSAHLQYTHQFKNADGVLESARLMPLARVRLNTLNQSITDESNDYSLGGSLILDLPKLGWLQGGYDTFYGASAGAGFNINRRMSLGYTMEKGFGTDFNNLGLTHEISFAYSFTPNLTEDRVMLEAEDELAENNELQVDALAANEELEELKRKLAENEEVLAELMFRQDSLEANRQNDLERRFEMVMRMVRNETKGTRPDLEKRAEDLFKTGKNTQNNVVSNTRATDRTNASDYTSENPENSVAATTARENQKSTVQQDAVNTVNSRPTRIATAVVQDKTNTKDVPNSMASAREKKVLPTQRRSAIQSSDPSNTTTAIAAQDNTQSSDYINAANRDVIKSRKFKNLEGVTDGYYVVANVYKGGKYMDKFMTSLNRKGFNSDFIDNPNNGLKYVYLERYDTWSEAAAAYKSNMNGSYTDDLWIMNVDNRYTNERYASNVDKLQQKSSKYSTDVLEPKVVERDKITRSDLKSRVYKIDGIGQGYYIIANVFANPNNANRFVKLLNSYGLSASYFINPENNWRYVYLKRHESWNNALISYYSKLNDAYDDKMWIMRVRSEAIA